MTHQKAADLLNIGQHTYADYGASNIKNEYPGK